MVNFYLNLDISGSSVAIAHLPDLITLTDVIIDTSNTVIVKLNTPLDVTSASNSNWFNELIIDISTSHTNSIISSETDTNSGGAVVSISDNNKELTFTFPDISGQPGEPPLVRPFAFKSNSGFDQFSRETIDTIRFRIKNESGETEEAKLLSLDLPAAKEFRRVISADEFDYIFKNNVPNPDPVVSRKPSVARIDINNRSEMRIEYNWGEASIQTDEQISITLIRQDGTLLNLSSSDAVVTHQTNSNVFIYNFQPIFKHGDDVSSITMTDVDYQDETGANVTETIVQPKDSSEIEPNYYVYNILPAEQTVGFVPGTSTLAEVTVPASVFQNVFKFKLSSALNFIPSTLSTFNIPMTQHLFTILQIYRITTDLSMNLMIGTGTTAIIQRMKIINHGWKMPIS